MFSGKSTELIRRVRRFQAIGKRVTVLNHHIDDRYGEEEQCSTHYGDGITAVKLSKLKNFTKRYAARESTVDVVCIDEAQFFGDLYESVRVMVETYNIHVIVAGLSGDFKRDNFGEIYKLFPLADTIVKLDAFCGVCNDGTKAPFTKKTSGGGDQVEVGSSDKYIAVCRRCYLKN
jgi:thymidine kinase